MLKRYWYSPNTMYLLGLFLNLALIIAAMHFEALVIEIFQRLLLFESGYCVSFWWELGNPICKSSAFQWGASKHILFLKPSIQLANYALVDL